MSADNWAQCPRCRERLNEKKKKAETKAANAYGIVAPGEFKKLEAEAAAIGVDPELTLREDYELGIDHEGKFYVRYSGKCREDECGFKHEFRHDNAEPGR